MTCHSAMPTVLTTPASWSKTLDGPLSLYPVRSGVRVGYASVCKCPGPPVCLGIWRWRLADDPRVAGDGDTGVDQLFDKAVGGGPSVSSLRQSTQIYFLVLAGLAIGGVFLAIAVNEILWYSAVGFETVDTVFTTVRREGGRGGGKKKSRQGVVQQ